MILKDFISQAEDYLKRSTYLDNGYQTPRLDVETILTHVLNKTRSWILARPEYKMSVDEQSLASKFIERREQGEPVAYIVGVKEFWNLTLHVNQSTIIPRPDTETLVEVVLELLGDAALKILDLGTGTGAIALALAKEKTQCHISGVDSKQAIELAKKNAVYNQISNTTFFESNWFEHVNDSYDVIVSNPPYIKQNDVHLTKGDLRFEPITALSSGKDGLYDIRHIVAHSSKYLNPHGMLVLEHGYSQGKQVQSIFKQSGFINVKTYKDLAGHERVTLGIKNNG